MSALQPKLFLPPAPKTREPVPFDAAKKQEILDLTTRGKLSTVNRRRDMPPLRTILRMERSDKVFGAMMREARELYYAAMAEELVAIADQAKHDFVDVYNPKTGESERRFNPLHVQRATLQIKTRQWVLERRMRAEYGNTVTVAGDPNNPIRVEMTLEEKTKRLQAIFATAAARLAVTNGVGETLPSTPEAPVSTSEEFEP